MKAAEITSRSVICGLVICLSLVLAQPGPAAAAEPGGFAVGQAGDPVHGALLRSLHANMPDVEVDWIRPGPVAGLYTVKFGRSIVYMDQSGRYLFAGGIFDLRAQVNLTAVAQGKEAAAHLWSEPLAELAIPLGNADAPDKELVVFDDVDCPYCRRQHPELTKLTEAGWRVWVLLYPVQKLHPHAYSKSVGIWCAEDRRQALLRAWAGERPAEQDCAHPLDRIQALGKRLGVAGTPTMVLKGGLLIQGYQDAAAIQQQGRQLELAAVTTGQGPRADMGRPGTDPKP